MENNVFDQGPQTNGKIVFSGKLDDKTSNSYYRISQRSNTIKFLVLSILAILAGVFMLSVNKQEGSDDITYLLFFGFALIFGLLSLISLLPIKLFGFYNKYCEPTFTFDPVRGIFSKTDKTYKTYFSMPLNTIKYIKDMGDFFVIKYHISKKQRKKNRNSAFGANTDFLVCQKNLITEGTIEDFIALIGLSVKEKKQLDKEERRKFKKYGISSIILSCVAVALTIPLVKFGDYLINDFLTDVVNWYTTGMGLTDTVAIIFGYLLFSPILFIFTVGSFILGIICYIAPFAFHIPAFILMVAQFVKNFRLWSWLSLVCLIASIFGAILIMSSMNLGLFA